MYSTTILEKDTLQLSPSQQIAYDRLLELLPKNPIISLVSERSYGRTTILQKLNRYLNGQFIRLANIFEEMKIAHPLQLEETLVKTLQKAFQENDYVICDDFHEIKKPLGGCYYDPARPSVWSFALDNLLHSLEQSGKHLILGNRESWLGVPFDANCLTVEIPEFTPLDFDILFQEMGAFNTNQLNFERVHRFVPKLDANQIRKACNYVQASDLEDTQEFIQFLEIHALASNVNQGEVAKVSLDDLFGIEEVKKQLEINLIVPLERDDLAKKLGMQPKRGVLLYGPPGTGKTTIGRALAHRLGSKFFLIDGTIISGTDQFYYKISQIFNKAKENSPSILFIDDCDLLFENEEETGLYRYLLTMLDGLESKSNEQVTIMLTAMNIGSLPPALIRSGRVELWLETKLPDLEARKSIVSTQLQGQFLQLNASAIDAFAEMTEGLTGSDLRRVMTDARNLHGYEVAKEMETRPPFYYFENALKQLQIHRKQLEDAPAYTAAHRPGVKR